jgi:hypothetical protein
MLIHLWCVFVKNVPNSPFFSFNMSLHGGGELHGWWESDHSIRINIIVIL